MSAARFGAVLSLPCTRARTSADDPSLLTSEPAACFGTVQYETTLLVFGACLSACTSCSPSARAAGLDAPPGAMTSRIRFGSPVSKRDCSRSAAFVDDAFGSEKPPELRWAAALMP